MVGLPPVRTMQRKRRRRRGRLDANKRQAKIKKEVCLEKRGRGDFTKRELLHK